MVILKMRSLFVACAAMPLLFTACSRSPLGAEKETASSAETKASVEALRLPESSSGYYGVYTASNVVLFGKLVRADSEWVVLNNVHYVRSNVDPDKKQIANQLVQRAKEWHKPGETAVSRRHVLVIEPVAQDSQMMTVIQQMK